MTRSNPRYYDLVPARGLLHGETGYSFECPYCGKVWDIPEGGRRVGFTKAAAKVHLSSCYDAALFLKGYVKKSYFPGRGMGNSDRAVPISRLDGSAPWHERTLRLLKIAVRKLQQEQERHTRPIQR